MTEQEKIMKINMLGQEAERIEQQMQVIEEQIKEFTAIRESLVNLENQDNKEILANLGKGIFAKAELKDRELYVNVGGQIVLKKGISETLEIIEDQTKKLGEHKEELIERIMLLQKNMQEILISADSSHSDACECGEEECKHCEDCDHDCDCEEDK